jgi:hypothetical protein
MDERSRWEERYRQPQEPFYGRDPSPFLRRSLPLLPPPGRCLDAAGGEGRNAAFLAALGWRVLLADVALAGVARARNRERPDTKRVRWNCAACVRRPRRLAAATRTRIPRPAPGRQLPRPRPGRLRRRAAAAGRSATGRGFAKEQLGRSSGGPQDLDLLWGSNELLRAAAGLRVLWYEDRLTADDDNPRHRGEKWVVRLIARREG